MRLTHDKTGAAIQQMVAFLLKHIIFFPDLTFSTGLDRPVQGWFPERDVLDSSQRRCLAGGKVVLEQVLEGKFIFCASFRPDLKGTNTGSEYAFLYPDLQTALFGEWEDGEIVSASPAQLVELSHDQGVAEPRFAICDDRQALSERRSS